MLYRTQKPREPSLKFRKSTHSLPAGCKVWAPTALQGLPYGKALPSMFPGYLLSADAMRLCSYDTATLLCTVTNPPLHRPSKVAPCYDPLCVFLKSICELEGTFCDESDCHEDYSVIVSTSQAEELGGIFPSS